MYDLIGNIHGYAAPLKRLLEKLGYSERGGVWQHPERKVIFLGDFIDRGPEQVETVQIARAMVEGGTAFAVMGNHEFNAIAWATPDPERTDHWLRPHTDKNRRQHQDLAGAGLNKIQFPVCSLSEQTQIINALESQFSEIETLELDLNRQLMKSETLRQSILKKLFSGQLVPQDPNDEPAAVLLERSRAEKTAQAKGRTGPGRGRKKNKNEAA